MYTQAFKLIDGVGSNAVSWQWFLVRLKWALTQHADKITNADSLLAVRVCNGVSV